MSVVGDFHVNISEKLAKSWRPQFVIWFSSMSISMVYMLCCVIVLVDMHRYNKKRDGSLALLCCTMHVMTMQIGVSSSPELPTIPSDAHFTPGRSPSRI